jgi:hypothetical protein
VRIAGTNFQLPPAPPSSGKTAGTIKPSVEVLFGTVPANEVHVLSATLLHVVSPIHDPGAVSITVRNIDQAGVLVPGETVTVASPAYTFALPDFNKTGHEESVLARVCRSLIREIKRQLIANVEITVHVDYDDTPDGANVAMLADLPGLVLSGPRLRENPEYWTNKKREVTKDGATYQQKTPRCVDLVFTVIGAHDTFQTLLNFMQETVAFFEENITLRVLSDPTIAGDYTEFEMDIEEDFAVGGGSNNSNVRAFSGTVLVRGVELDDEDMAIEQVFDVLDVAPTGSPDEALPRPYILTGMPGTSPAAPIPANPAPGPGNSGPIEQIPPTDE